MAGLQPIRGESKKRTSSTVVAQSMGGGKIEREVFGRPSRRLAKKMIDGYQKNSAQKEVKKEKELAARNNQGSIVRGRAPAPVNKRWWSKEVIRPS